LVTDGKITANHTMTAPRVDTVVSRTLPPEIFKKMGGSFMPKSLPTNVVDPPRAININHLRANTEMDVWPGRSYAAKTLNGNWVEERFDRTYGGGVLKYKTSRPETWSTTQSVAGTQVLKPSLPDGVPRKKVNYLSYQDTVPDMYKTTTSAAHDNHETHDYQRRHPQSVRMIETAQNQRSLQENTAQMLIKDTEYGRNFTKDFKPRNPIGNW